MVFKVKNTTFLRNFSLFDVICPENCRGCGARGEMLCERCKKYIFAHYQNHCPVCKQELSGGVCRKCKGGRARIEGEEKGKGVYEIFKGIYSVGFRDEIIGEMVEEYKYYSVRGLSGALAEILEGTVFREVGEKIFNRGSGSFKGQNVQKSTGKLPLILVPLPTARKHIRERGFDHTKLIMKKVSRDFKRGEAEVLELLLRAKDTTQVGASEKKRLKQAKEAYRLNPKYFREVSEGEFQVKEKYREILRKPVVLFDDVWTTGASLTEAAKMLQRAGIREIYGVVLAVNRRGRKPILRRGIFGEEK